MTLNQLLAKLEEIKVKKPKAANFPVQILDVQDGIPYAINIHVELAEKEDGDRVWIYQKDEESPLWFGQHDSL